MEAEMQDISLRSEAGKERTRRKEISICCFSFKLNRKELSMA